MDISGRSLRSSVREPKMNISGHFLRSSVRGRPSTPLPVVEPQAVQVERTKKKKYHQSRKVTSFKTKNMMQESKGEFDSFEEQPDHCKTTRRRDRSRSSGRTTKSTERSRSRVRFNDEYVALRTRSQSRAKSPAPGGRSGLVSILKTASRSQSAYRSPSPLPNLHPTRTRSQSRAKSPAPGGRSGLVSILKTASRSQSAYRSPSPFPNLHPTRSHGKERYETVMQDSEEESDSAEEQLDLFQTAGRRYRSPSSGRSAQFCPCSRAGMCMGYRERAARPRHRSRSALRRQNPASKWRASNFELVKKILLSNDSWDEEESRSSGRRLTKSAANSRKTGSTEGKSSETDFDENDMPVHRRVTRRPRSAVQIDDQMGRRLENRTKKSSGVEYISFIKRERSSSNSSSEDENSPGGEFFHRVRREQSSTSSSKAQEGNKDENSQNKEGGIGTPYMDFLQMMLPCTMCSGSPASFPETPGSNISAQRQSQSQASSESPHSKSQEHFLGPNINLSEDADPALQALQTYSSQPTLSNPLGQLQFDSQFSNFMSQVYALLEAKMRQKAFLPHQSQNLNSAMQVLPSYQPYSTGCHQPYFFSQQSGSNQKEKKSQANKKGEQSYSNREGQSLPGQNVNPAGLTYLSQQPYQTFSSEPSPPDQRPGFSLQDQRSGQTQPQLSPEKIIKQTEEASRAHPCLPKPDQPMPHGKHCQPSNAANTTEKLIQDSKNKFSPASCMYRLSKRFIKIPKPVGGSNMASSLPILTDSNRSSTLFLQPSGPLKSRRQKEAGANTPATVTSVQNAANASTALVRAVENMPPVAESGRSSTKIYRAPAFFKRSTQK